jgi:hypothetical protein
MEINRANKSMQINTVQEQDGEVALKKAATNTAPKIRDQYEETSSSHVCKGYESSSSAAEPERKADQIAVGMLAKQLTQARLADPGRKQNGTQSERSGRTELNKNERDAAAAKEPQIPSDQGRRTGESGDKKSQKERQDYLAKHGYANQSGEDKMKNSEKGHEVQDAMAGSQDKPGDARSRLDEKAARQKGYATTADDIRSGFHDQIHDAVTQNGGAAAGSHPYGKDMMASNSGKMPWQSKTDPSKHGYEMIQTSKTSGGTEISTYTRVEKDDDDPNYTRIVQHTHYESGYDKETDNVIGKNGSTMTTTEVFPLGNGEFNVQRTVTTYDKDHNQTSEETTNSVQKAPPQQETSEEGYEKQQSEKLHQAMQNNQFGINPWATPSSHHSPGHNSGNVDGKEKIDKGALDTNVAVQAGGMSGMLGQGRGLDYDGVSGGGGHVSGQSGGATDYEDQSGSTAEHRTENPEDVNTNVGGTQLNWTPRTTNDDDDDDDDEQEDTTKKTR